MTNQPPSQEDIQEKVFAHSYGEVLLFLKHQDDKINRVLTALAFLTAAGVTLYVVTRAPSVDGLAPPPTFSNTHVQLDDYFFASFILGVALSVALSLVALDPTSFRPRFLDRHPDPDTEKHSLLFYEAIQRLPRKKWHGLIEASDLRTQYIRSLNDDAHRLSRRAIHKVHRFGTASCVVQFTIVALALLGMTRLDRVHASASWKLIVAVLGVYAVMPLVDYLYFLALDFPDVQRHEGIEGAHPQDTRETAIRIAGALCFLLPFLGVALAALATRPHQWQTVTVVLFGTLALRLIERFAWSRLAPWLHVFIMLGITTAGAFLVWCD